jgi:hypothetical protein
MPIENPSIIEIDPNKNIMELFGIDQETYNLLSEKFADKWADKQKDLLELDEETRKKMVQQLLEKN